MQAPRSRLTKAAAEELFQLTEAALTAKFNWANAMASYGSRSPECEAAEKVDSEAYRALYAWQRAHGLPDVVTRESK